MTDAQYLLPTKIPNGEYLGGTIELGGSLISAAVEWPSPYNGVTRTHLMDLSLITLESLIRVMQQSMFV